MLLLDTHLILWAAFEPSRLSTKAAKQLQSRELPIRAAHVVRAATLPWVHRDPFDRLLVAQALEDRLTLLTSDATLKGYGRFIKVV